MAGRRPKPRNLKLLQGNPGKRPIKDEVKITSVLPGPPEWLQGESLAEWNRLQGPLSSAGILDGSSWSLFVLYCRMFGDLVGMIRAGVTPQASLMSQFRLLAGSFGLDPSTRSRLVGKKAEGVNPFDEL